MKREISIIEAAVMALLCLVLIVHYIHAYADETTEILLNEVRAQNLSTPPVTLKCFQERVRGGTHICITENEWRKQHAQDLVEK